MTKKLSEEKKAEVIKRLLAKESIIALAKEFGISKSTLALWKAKAKAKSKNSSLSPLISEPDKFCPEDAESAKDQKIEDLVAENIRLKCYIADSIVLHKFICDSSDD